MQMFRSKNRRLFHALVCLALFVHATLVSGATPIEQTNSLLSQWVQSKGAINDVSRSEIWSRVRSRLHISTPTSAPLFQRHVREYARSQSYINKLANNASPYLYYILEEVEKRGMPSEIALLPMIESDFNPHNLSHAGALGIWQIMPALGRIYGLKQNSIYDGRRDIYESTKVALDHLEYLHKKFGGSWPLALAAYNSGESRVLNAIKKNKAAKKPTDYWSLNLPRETTNYVPKLLALASIVKSPKQYGITLPHIPNQPVFTRVSTTKAIDIARAAKLVDVSETQLRKLNPGFRRTANPTGPFQLVVPIQRANTIKEKIETKTTPVAKTTPIAKSTPAVAVKTKAKTKSTTTATVVNTNAKASKDVKTVAKKSHKIHVVKRGESIPKIAQKHGLKISTLLAYNNLKSQSSVIQPGQKLIVG